MSAGNCKDEKIFVALSGYLFIYLFVFSFGWRWVGGAKGVEAPERRGQNNKDGGGEDDGVAVPRIELNRRRRTLVSFFISSSRCCRCPVRFPSSRARFFRACELAGGGGAEPRASRVSIPASVAINIHAGSKRHPSKAKHASASSRLHL